MQKKRRISQVIWDFNGTIVNDVDLCLKIVNEHLIKKGLPILTKIHYREIFEFPVKKYLTAAGLEFTEFEFTEFSHSFHQRYAELFPHCHLYDGIPKHLKNLTERGIQQSILSALEQSRLEKMTAHYGIADHFRELSGLSDIYAASKVANGKALIEKHEKEGISKDEVLLIGDTNHDLEVANSMGVPCALVSYGHQNPTRLKKNHTQVFANLEDLFHFYL